MCGVKDLTYMHFQNNDFKCIIIDVFWHPNTHTRHHHICNFGCFSIHEEK